MGQQAMILRLIITENNSILWDFEYSSFFLLITEVSHIAEKGWLHEAGGRKFPLGKKF